MKPDGTWSWLGFGSYGNGQPAASQTCAEKQTSHQHQISASVWKVETTLTSGRLCRQAAHLAGTNVLRWHRRLVIGVDDLSLHSLSDNAVLLSARVSGDPSPSPDESLVFQRSKNHTSSGEAIQRLSQQSEFLHKNVKTALHDLNRPNWHHLLSRQIPPEPWPAFACHKSGHKHASPLRTQARPT